MNSYTEKYKKLLLPIILHHLPDVKIILYGSRARLDDREGSDIDIALDAGSKIDSKTMTKIYFDIEESSLPIKFDLVDLHAVSERMQKDILKDGVLWHE